MTKVYWESDTNVERAAVLTGKVVEGFEATPRGNNVLRFTDGSSLEISAIGWEVDCVDFIYTPRG